MKSSHSKIFHINVSFYTRLSIANHWGPLGALVWALRVRKRSQQASNHQTFLSPSFTQAAGSFPIVKSSHSKILYLGFSWHTRLSIRNHWGSSGVLGGPLIVWKQPKHAYILQIFLCPPLFVTPCFPIVKSSHSETFHLDFSWHPWSSIGNHFGPLLPDQGPIFIKNKQFC